MNRVDCCREDYWESVLFFTKHFKSVHRRDLTKRQKWFRKKWYLVILECLHVIYCCTRYIYVIEYLLHGRTDDFSFLNLICFVRLFFLTIDVVFNTIKLQRYEYCFARRAKRICGTFRKKSFLRHVPIRYTTQILG